jgi:hypothetical protein
LGTASSANKEAATAGIGIGALDADGKAGGSRAGRGVLTLNNRDPDFYYAIEVGCVDGEMSFSFSQYRTITWTRVMLVRGKVMPELLLTLARDEI